MLAHQLPQLPPVDGMVDRIASGILDWLDQPAPAAPVRLPAFATPAGEEPLAAPGLRYWGSRSGPALESIRFAGANRLHVEFEYKQKHRVVEPYSLRRSRAGNVLLYAWELAAGHIKAFDLGKISHLRVGARRFQPRYAVQLGVGSPTPVPPVARRPNEFSKPSDWRGPAYVYECAVCGRRFLHKKRDSSLQRHNGGQGFRCSSRRGHVRRDGLLMGLHHHRRTQSWVRRTALLALCATRVTGGCVAAGFRVAPCRRLPLVTC
jgi:hypothetical protein